MPRKKADTGTIIDENAPKTVKKEPKKKHVGTANLKPVQTKEEAKARGRKGGIKSGEVRRAKKDARESVRYLLNLAAKGNLKENLKGLGLPETEQTNMAALQARLFTMAMSGNLDAYKELMKVAGFDSEENRKERELDAKVAAISNNPDARVSLGLGAEDGGSSDVIIYLPEIDPISEEPETIEEATPEQDSQK